MDGITLAGVESEKNKWLSSDLGGTQHWRERKSFQTEEPVKETIKERSDRLMGKQQREMSESEAFYSPFVPRVPTTLSFPQYYLLKDKNVPFL